MTRLDSARPMIGDGLGIGQANGIRAPITGVGPDNGSSSRFTAAVKVCGAARPLASGIGNESAGSPDGYRLRAFQISSHGHRRAHSSGTCW